MFQPPYIYDTNSTPNSLKSHGCLSSVDEDDLQAFEGRSRYSYIRSTLFPGTSFQYKRSIPGVDTQSP